MLILLMCSYETKDNDFKAIKYKAIQNYDYFVRTFQDYYIYSFCSKPFNTNYILLYTSYYPCTRTKYINDLTKNESD